MREEMEIMTKKYKIKSKKAKVLKDLEKLLKISQDKIDKSELSIDEELSDEEKIYELEIAMNDWMNEIDNWDQVW